MDGICKLMILKSLRFQIDLVNPFLSAKYSLTTSLIDTFFAFDVVYPLASQLPQHKPVAIVEWNGEME